MPPLKYVHRIIVPSLVIVSLVIGHCALALEYDGIWFLGLNEQNKLFQDTKVRQAVNQSIDKQFVVTDIMSAEVAPASLVPPSMLGYDPDLASVELNWNAAKQLMKEAGYPLNDKRLKNISLLHTDGLKTIAIAEKIQSDLRNIGLKVYLTQIAYEDQDEWNQALASGQYDLFLMGCKANVEDLFTEEAAVVSDDSYALLAPLFATKGEANFTGYSNKEVDKLLGQVSGLNAALKSERHAKLKTINDILYQDSPIVVLFYIEKL